ncbi:group III truncated hemoglobin [Maricaulis sp. D1M11]|uniref:group III truncated hemoglobin n=1 Tax=Maricaulis sp. D1M11 TaxID=3076117 RepID=UPI0039B63181
MQAEILPPRRAAIDEVLIRDLVHTFYGRIREHPVLGPIFNHAIGDEWDPHLARMCDFWSGITLRTGRFKGNPAVAHMRHKTIRPEHFDLWLTVWDETVAELAEGHAALTFRSAAHRMGSNLRGVLYAR